MELEDLRENGEKQVRGVNLEHNKTNFAIWGLFSCILIRDRNLDPQMC